jgi:hypothetical protein
VTLVASDDGTVRYLASDEHADLTHRLGPVARHDRCSRVDAWDDLAQPARRYIQEHYARHACRLDVFWVDLLKLGGCVLGPYPTYHKAIEEEIAWLLQHHLPRSR